MTDYHPIECGLHSSYELAVLQGGEHLLTLPTSETAEKTIVIIPLDIITRSGEEFLVYRTHHVEEHEIRLDHIHRLVKA